jgi:hypothetical protein
VYGIWNYTSIQNSTVCTLDTYQEKYTTFLNSQIEPEFALDFLQSLYNVDFAGKP